MIRELYNWVKNAYTTPSAEALALKIAALGVEGSDFDQK